MQTNNYKPPQYRGERFNCPSCEAFAQQRWYQMRIKKVEKDFLDKNYISTSTWQAKCESCQNVSIWYDEKMIYPSESTAPPPYNDMPKDVKKIYNEARDISNLSPRAAAALLRVALEVLTVHLGETKGNLNKRIGNLKKKGLPERIIRGLDIVRITANEGGAHPGQIDLEGKDNEGIVNKLFKIVNFIVEETISKPNTMDEIFDELPEDKKKGIINRDTLNK